MKSAVSIIFAFTFFAVSATVPAFSPMLINAKHKQQLPKGKLLALDDSTNVETQKQEDRLLSLLAFIAEREPDRLAFGLDCDPQEQGLVASVVGEVEEDTTHNLLSKNNGKIVFADLQGDWKLLYTSSRTMIINKSLSGLGRSSSELAQVGSLIQRLGGSKFLGTVDFIEHFGKDGKDSEDNSLGVTISGEWFTKPEKNVFTGAPTTALVIEPATVQYGPSTNAAQDWSSLGPIKLLDILYLSENISILRNNVNTDSLFVWQRI